MVLFIQAAVLAKGQRRKGRKGEPSALVGLNSQRPYGICRRIYLLPHCALWYITRSISWQWPARQPGL